MVLLYRYGNEKSVLIDLVGGLLDGLCFDLDLDFYLDSKTVKCIFFLDFESDLSYDFESYLI